MSRGGEPGDCGGHTGLTGEFRTVVLTAIDRAGPVVERLRAEAPTASAATTCAVCPVCAVLAALRGERTEYSVRVAEHLAGILEVLRVALVEGDPAAARAERPAPETPQETPQESPRPAAAGRTVQRIPVVRVGSRT